MAQCKLSSEEEVKELNGRIVEKDLEIRATQDANERLVMELRSREAELTG